MRLTPIALNHSYYTSGDFAVALVDNYAGTIQQLYAPVFSNKYEAEVFALRLPFAELEEGPEAELEAARALLAFIKDFDERYDGVDSRYPTPNNRYPSAKQMAEWFQKSRQRAPVAA